MYALDQELNSKLEDRNRVGLKRNLILRDGLIDFCSNDYLGLSRDPILKRAVKNEISINDQLKLGSGGSRLLAGNTQLSEKLEGQLADIHKSPSTLLFNNGYAANLSFFSAIPQKGDTIIYDEFIHTCIKDGARLGFADRLTFKHNDVQDLVKKINRAKGRVFIAVESVYSMDGDFAPMLELVKIAKNFDCHLVVDEAHSTGLWGKGAGLCVELGIEDQILVRIHTFGKGIGAHGACIACSETLKQYLVNFARPFIFTTAAPDHSLIVIKKAYEYISNNEDLWTRLKHKIHLFNTLVRKEKIESESPIQAVLFPGNETVKSVAKNIQEEGFDVRPILSPTVKAGGERIRVCLHTFNTDEQIAQLAQLINEA